MGTTDGLNRTCPACGKQTPADARFCMHCAAPFTQRCPACGQDAPATASFCPNCAHPLALSTEQTVVSTSGLSSQSQGTASGEQAPRPSGVVTSQAAQEATKQGIAYLQAMRLEEALSAFEQAIRLDSKNARAYRGKGDTLDKLKRYEEAILAFDSAIKFDPASTESLCNKGATLYRLQRYAEALPLFDQAISADPGNTSAYNNRGATLNQLRRYEEALAAYQQTLRVDPLNVGAYAGKGNALNGLGRTDEARAAFAEAERLKSETISRSATPSLSARPATTSAMTPYAASFGLTTGTLLALIGGVVSLLALFLPWASVLFISVSLWDILVNSTNQVNVSGNWVGWVEPIAAIALIFFSLRARYIGKAAHTWNLVASLAGLGLILYVFVVFSSAIKGVNLVSLLGIGFWLAAIGFALGLVGAIKGASDSTG